ncbi:unnamed protein product [Rotaria sp. Silwood2]|nr:unnamed protein product [Rotaria sp. Silwood2]CAF2845340.1 unnamed protein product [Rotaria sp. Silwood2]CAF3017177.1 unnamed protein product [Rotaria sp. Silwood2]
MYLNSTKVVDQNISTEKSPSGEQSTETLRQDTAGTVEELSTQNQTGETAGQIGSGTGIAGQILPTATAESMTHCRTTLPLVQDSGFNTELCFNIFVVSCVVSGVCLTFVVGIEA